MIKWPTSRCGNPVTQIFYRNRFWTGSAAIIYPSHRLSNNRNFEFSVWMYFVIVVGSRESTRYFVFYFYFYGGIDLRGSWSAWCKSSCGISSELGSWMLSSLAASLEGCRSLDLFLFLFVLVLCRSLSLLENQTHVIILFQKSNLVSSDLVKNACITYIKIIKNVYKNYFNIFSVNAQVSITVDMHLIYVQFFFNISIWIPILFFFQGKKNIFSNKILHPNTWRWRVQSGKWY